MFNKRINDNFSLKGSLFFDNKLKHRKQAQCTTQNVTTNAKRNINSITIFDQNCNNSRYNIT